MPAPLTANIYAAIAPVAVNPAPADRTPVPNTPVTDGLPSFSHTLSSLHPDGQQATQKQVRLRKNSDDNTNDAAAASQTSAATPAPLPPSNANDNADADDDATLEAIMNDNILRASLQGELNAAAPTAPMVDANASPLQIFSKLLADLQANKAAVPTLGVIQDVVNAQSQSPALAQALSQLAQMQQQWLANQQQNQINPADASHELNAQLAQLAASLQQSDPNEITQAVDLTAKQFTPEVATAAPVIAPTVATPIVTANSADTLENPYIEDSAVPVPVITPEAAAPVAKVVEAEKQPELSAAQQPAPSPVQGGAQQASQPKPSQLVHQQETVTTPAAVTVTPADSTAQDDSNTQSGNGDGKQQAPAFLSAAPNAEAQPAVSQNQTAPVSFAHILSEAQRPVPATPTEQMVAQVKSASQNGESRIQMQLHPADLGKLEITMSVAADGKANLQITADNHRTLQLLQSDARALEQRLTDIGLKADSGSLNFSLSGDQQSNGQYLPQGKNQQSNQQAYRGSAQELLDEAMAIAPTRSYAFEGASGLDISI